MPGSILVLDETEPGSTSLDLSPTNLAEGKAKGKGTSAMGEASRDKHHRTRTRGQQATSSKAEANSHGPRLGVT
jgi:hypothetical protein